MKRPLPFIICFFGGLLLLGIGWLIPAHLRAVDLGVIQMAGANTVSLVERGQTLAERNNLGSAEMLLRAAEKQGILARPLATSVAVAVAARPAWIPLGGASPRLESVFGVGPSRAGATNMPFTAYVLGFERLDRVMEFLSASPDPAIKNLQRCRSLTNLAVFPPSRSSAGQAFDAALATCSLLIEENSMSLNMSDKISKLAANALNGGGSDPLEQVLLDYMSLGERFDWNQLQVFNAHIEDPGTLHLLANFVRQASASGREPVVFAAVVLSERPVAVANYLSEYSKTGVGDLGGSLASGQGGVQELLRRNLRLADSPTRETVKRSEPFGSFLNFATDYCWRRPGIALTMRWLIYLAAGFLLASALHYAQPAPPELQRPLEVRGASWAREFLFALGFLLVVLLLSEPFLAQESQRMAMPSRLHLPTAGGAVPAGMTGATTTFMNPSNLLTMLLFFVLQGLLYIACLVKLGEIRRQRVPARMKLKLLENEDHLFDAGLYLGFLGTIVSFILFSLAIMPKFSLMVAYSSTSFGIVFVSCFKILNLRPLRRQLLLEADVESAGMVATETRAPMVAA